MLAVDVLDRPVEAIVRPPGSKSLTNRALVAAALARPGASRIHDPLEADDTRRMRSGLGAFGTLIDDNDDPWLVLGTGGDLEAPSSTIDVGASGTTARFLTAVAALAAGKVSLDGSDRMRERPMRPLIDSLTTMGASISAPGGGLPVAVNGKGRLDGGVVTVDATTSSQFASAILLVAPLATDPVDIRLTGPVVSRPYLDGTVEIMRAFGADVSDESERFLVKSTGYEKAHVTIEADASAAVYPAVAAAITGGTVLIEGIPPSSTQPDLAVFDILEQMGCNVNREQRGIRVAGPEGALQPVESDLSGCPDGAMAVAVAALFASGPSRLEGLSTLRLKETDRLKALETELRRVGGAARATDDSLEVRPGHLRGAEIETYDDHRMAMSMALVGLVVPGIMVSRPEVVSKTWPGYFQMMSAL